MNLRQIINEEIKKLDKVAKNFIKEYGWGEYCLWIAQYYLSLVRDWKLNKLSIIPYENWYEMEGWEVEELHNKGEI